MASMQSRFQFPLEVNFDELEPQPLKDGRHSQLVDRAKTKSSRPSQLFVDCSSTVRFLAYGEGVSPPIVPNHPFYALPLSRYLGAKDCTQCQGMWESCWDPAVYANLIDEGNNTFTQDLCGNSFSSTVCLAATLTSFASAPSVFVSHYAKRGVKRRLKGKQDAPEYQPTKPKASASTKRSGKYKRKVPGQDSRRKNKGKSCMVSIWDKEQLFLGLIYCLGIWKHSKCLSLQGYVFTVYIYIYIYI